MPVGMASKPRPTLVERAHVRVPVMFMAQISTGDKRVLGRVRNLSDNGLCVATREGLQTGQIVEIQFVAPRRISARVVWANGKIAGLRFCRQINANAEIGCLPDETVTLSEVR